MGLCVDLLIACSSGLSDHGRRKKHRRPRRHQSERQPVLRRSKSNLSDRPHLYRNASDSRLLVARPRVSPRTMLSPVADVNTPHRSQRQGSPSSRGSLVPPNGPRSHQSRRSAGQPSRQRQTEGAKQTREGVTMPRVLTRARSFDTSRSNVKALPPSVLMPPPPTHMEAWHGAASVDSFSVGPVEEDMGWSNLRDAQAQEWTKRNRREVAARAARRHKSESASRKSSVRSYATAEQVGWASLDVIGGRRR